MLIRARRRLITAAAAKVNSGNHTQRISDKMTVIPLGEKKRESPRGDTSIGCNGAKYRSLTKGHKKAIPRPPLVNASSMPCDATATNKNQNARFGVDNNCLAIAAPMAATMNANNKEWLNPR